MKTTVSQKANLDQSLHLRLKDARASCKAAHKASLKVNTKVGLGGMLPVKLMREATSSMVSIRNQMRCTHSDASIFGKVLCCNQCGASVEV